MDIFESRYYRINKYLLTSLGQWPYQDPLQKSIIRTVVNCLFASVFVPEILQLIDVWGELDAVIDSVSAIGVQFTNNAKLYNYIFNADKVQLLITRIRDDWAANFVGPQLDILKDYANEGRKLTVVYSVCMFGTLAFYSIMPLMNKVLDVVTPLNESRPVAYQLPAKYGSLNMEKYYYPIMLHADVSSIFTVIAIIAMDTAFVVYVQHACGIFAALGHRLENLIGANGYEGLDGLSAEQQEEVTYQAVVSCAKMHKDAIEFADAIESTHVIVFFIVFAMSVFCMSVTGFQMIIKLDKPNEAIRFLTFIFAETAHIFFISWGGQKLIDHSQRIHESVYSARWYLAGDRSKKLLMIMMLRSIEPCKLTAGKFYVVDFANFSLIVRTSVSYFTMLTSFK